MSKKIEDSELQTLTLSPTNTNDDECSPFVNLASDETSFPISPPQSYSTVANMSYHEVPLQADGTTSSTVTKDEKRKVERLISAPVNSVKVAPNLRVSTPPGSTRITYSNERSNERKIDLSKISRDRPTPGNTLSQKKDVADVRQIEQGLLQLMEDFQAGNLRAFGKDSRLRQMEAIREQQERLARLHFEVGAEQDLYPPLSEEGLRTSHDNMRTLMEKLAQLSESIERLHTNTSSDRKTSSSERKAGVHQMGGGQMNSRTNEHANHTNFHSGGTAAHQTYENQHRPNNPTGTPSRNSGGNPMPHSFSTNVTNSSIHQSSPGNPRPLSGQHRSRNTPVHHTGLVKNGTVLESS